MKLSIDFLKDLEGKGAPSKEEIKSIRARNRSASALELDGQAQFERRKAMIATVTTEPVLDAEERYIDGNDLLPINYLLLGYLQSRSVGRVTYFDRSEGKTASATGFLITNELMLTNHHVFPVDDLAGFNAFADDARMEFNYEYDLSGKAVTPIVFALDPARCLITNKALDMAIVAVAPMDVTGRHALKDQGYLVLNGELGKAGLGDFATVIQHPEGKDKKIALRNNEIIDNRKEHVILYVSDTAHGSSGGCACNNEWQVIALHSAGEGKKNANGDYIDKHGEVIVPENGMVDGDRVVWESNRGIRVSSIMAHLKSLPPHPMIQVLFSPAYTDSRPFLALSMPTNVQEAERVVVSPATPIAPPSFNIHIAIGSGAAPAVSIAGPSMSGAAVQDGFEKKYEDELDFTDCAGFDEDFLGEHIPMPTPGPQLRKKLAFLLESPSNYLLHYHHFSAIHHAVRRVPVVAAINVDKKQRYAELDLEGSRKDKWYRDNRIDYDVQLNDDFYAKSGFDKGHVCRREDAEWGSTVARAKQAADLTCSYTNAVPQVPSLNRNRYGYHGLWGQLEEKLLEEGVELEKGKSGRICVFAGPLFKPEDPVFKGVQVALDFFKVVVWYDGKGELRTTCFTLTQEEQVSGIDFEVLRFDKIFRNHQCPIEDIEKATGLKFHENITSRDTHTKADGAKEVTHVTMERWLKKF